MIEAIIEIKETILNAIGDRLGMYQVNNKSFPAVCLLPDKKYGFEYPPDTFTVKGLELAIVKVPPKMKQLLGEDVSSMTRLEIHLKQWDKTQDSIMSSVIEDVFLSLSKKWVLSTPLHLFRGTQHPIYDITFNLEISSVVSIEN